MLSFALVLASSVGFGLETLEPQIRTLAAPLLDQDHVVGLAVGVMKGGERHTFGIGRVRADSDDAPTGTTIYEIGSISKVFTAVLFADAADRGLLKIDDPLAKYVPAEFEAPTFDGQGIVLEQLSTHRSALPRMPPNWLPPDLADPFKGYGRERLYLDLENVVLTRAPGAQYEYSNLAVGLLGQILVDVNKAPSYEALLRERITVPLGLVDTGLDLSDEQKSRFAPAHNADLDPDHAWSFDALAGCGAIRSTVTDLLEFAAADLAAKDDAIGKAMTATHAKRAELPMDPAGGVGLGWHLRADGVRWHNGQTGGYHAFLGIDPNHDAAIAVLSNSPSGLVDPLAIKIAKLVIDGTMEPLPLPPPVEVERSILETYVGKYRLNPVNWITVTLVEKGLKVQLTGQPAFRVYPENEALFRYRIVDATISFETDDANKVVALVLHQNGQDMRSPRE